MNLPSGYKIKHTALGNCSDKQCLSCLEGITILLCLLLEAQRWRWCRHQLLMAPDERSRRVGVISSEIPDCYESIWDTHISCLCQKAVEDKGAVVKADSTMWVLERRRWLLKPMGPWRLLLLSQDHRHCVGKWELSVCIPTLFAFSEQNPNLFLYLCMFVSLIPKSS